MSALPLDSIVNEALNGKVVLLCGATGFVGKVVLERVLRVAPDVERIYVLVRSRGAHSPQARFDAEVLQSDALAAVRTLAAARCVVVGGDALQASVLLGAATDALRRELSDAVQLVINCVGSLNYAASLAAAVRAEVRTAHNLVAFAQRMRRLRLFITTTSRRILVVHHRLESDCSLIIK